MTNKKSLNKQKVQEKALSFERTWQLQMMFILTPLFIILAALMA